MAKRKSFTEKLTQHAHPPKIVDNQKPFAGLPPGAKVRIATPMEVKDYIDAIPRGETRSVAELREALSKPHGADGACPLTTGIFLRIVGEAALEARDAGVPEDRITPFWRIVEPQSPLAGKLSCGRDFIARMRKEEAA
jgi:hypothetical protein